jgi:hypothetical protein
MAGSAVADAGFITDAIFTLCALVYNCVYCLHLYVEEYLYFIGDTISMFYHQAIYLHTYICSFYSKSLVYL